MISIMGNAQVAMNPSVFKPDSMIYYADSLENERYMLMINKYEGDSIDVAAYWYDEDTVNYATKSVYYMDENIPALPFEPIFSGGRKGSSSGYIYFYTSTIGDSLSKSYEFDFDEKTWVKVSKTKHNISGDGIDTLAITHSWDEDSKSWELNNLSRQTYINSTTDTLKVLMLAPDLNDTIHYDVFSYEYNSDSKKSIIWRATPGDLYRSVDSITYYVNGLMEFIYYGNNYDCVNSSLPDCDNQYLFDYAEQYFYDTEGRLDKIYFWYKQDLTEWTLDGCFQYYYSTQPTFIEKVDNKEFYKIYPNPCNSTLKIDSFTGRVEIYNSLGQLMISEPLENGGLINTSPLRKGVYILKLGDLHSCLISKQ